MFLKIFEIEDFAGLDGFVRGLFVSLVAILIVFAILLLICLSVYLLKIVGKKSLAKEKALKGVNASETLVASETKKSISIDDIKDEDMMAAVLVATIDFVSENKKDARVVSVKQIG